MPRRQAASSAAAAAPDASSAPQAPQKVASRLGIFKKNSKKKKREKVRVKQKGVTKVTVYSLIIP
jgi:hypothetical protein